MPGVIQTKVQSVEQVKTGEEGKPLFTLDRGKIEHLSGTPSDLELQEEIGPEEEVQSAVISQVASGLENLRIADVRSVEDPENSKLSFDMKTVYRALNGLIYTVETAKEGEKVLAKLHVAFDPAFAETLKEQARSAAEIEAKEKAAKEAAGEVAKKAAEQQSSAAGNAQVSPESTASPASVPSAVPTPTPDPAAALQIASQEEADKLNEQFGPWVYELASYQGNKFRKTRADLTKPKEQPKTNAQEELKKEESRVLPPIPQT